MFNEKKVCVIFLIHNVNANICLIFLFLPQTEHSCRSSPECSSPGCSASSAQVSAYNSPWCRRRHPHSGHNEPGPGVCIHAFAPCYSTREQTFKNTLRICAHLSHREERDNLKRKVPFPPVRERSPARRDVPPSPHSRSGSSISSRSYSPERGKVHPFPPQQGKSMKNLQSKCRFNDYLVFLWFWFIYTTVQNFGVRMEVYILIIHACIIMHDGVYDLNILTSTQHWWCFNASGVRRYRQSAKHLCISLGEISLAGSPTHTDSRRYKGSVHSLKCSLWPDVDYLKHVKACWLI